MTAHATDRKSTLIIGASRARAGARRRLPLPRVVRDRHRPRRRTDRAARPGGLGRRATDRGDVDITRPEQVTALHARVAGTVFDLLFVNAAITNGDVPVTDVSTETFNHVMVTNALSPIRVIEVFQDVVPPTGTIGIMSSRQGSITLNDRAGYEVYRASKSALNQLMRSFAARHADDPRTLLLLCPGWVQTELGGPAAPLTIEESIPGVVDTIEKHAGEGGLHFVDHRNQTVPW